MPQKAKHILAAAIRAEDAPAIHELHEKIKEAGLENAGTSDNLRQWLHRKRAKAGTSCIKTMAAKLAKSRADAPPKGYVDIPMRTGAAQKIGASITPERRGPLRAGSSIDIRDGKVTIQALIEVHPNGLLVTTDPELAVQLSRMLAGGAV